MKRLILSLIIFTLPISLMAENFTQGHIQKLEQLKNPTLEDLEHEFKGCPANSYCSQEAGKRMYNWSKDFKRYAKRPSAQMHSDIEQFKKFHGIPIQFLTKRENFDALSNNSIMWSSRCSKHRNKEGYTILKGISFDKQIRPESGKIYPKVTITSKNGTKTYLAPYDQSPLLVIDDQLIFGMDTDEGGYYYIWVSENGAIKIKPVEQALINKSLLKIDSVKCQDQESGDDIFSLNICKKIWDKTKNTLVDMKTQWSCP